ncbi:MAG: 1-acyl-sn-glycerol-3-phosphate acyltransferase [Burkholderiaceae bacterium]|nr:1-acyl-sn-glycerol-3-phosphate acyltransferase [Burkholderiaceae bacterium]
MMRILWRAVLLSLLLLFGLLILFSFYRFIPLAQRCAARRVWSRLLLAIGGVRLEVEKPRGLIADSPMLVVMNHVSWLDIFVLNSVLPSTFIAKSEIRQWPLVGWLLMGADTLFIERASRHAVRHVNHRILERLRRGEHVAFFPESTTSDGTLVLPFHSSLFAMAVPRKKGGDESGTVLLAPPRVLPVALRYFQYDAPSLIPAYIGEQTFLESVLAILTARGLSVRLRILEPMLPADAEITRQMLAQMAHRRVSAAVDALA